MQKTTPTDDERAIRELIETWMTSTKADDTQTVLNLMTDDVVFMVPEQKPFGKEAFRKTVEEMKGEEASGVRFEGESDIEEIKVIGNWAYTRTRLRVVSIPSASGPSVHRSGYTLSILHKESDGRWRLARDANLLTVEK
jgi:uncharacterized protein (TIGR02246 family)